MTDTLGMPVPVEAARPGDLLGYTRRGEPIWLVAGAADDDPPVEPDDEDDEDDDEPDDDPNAYRPPSEDEWKAAQDALKRANREASNRRKWLENNGINPRTGKKIVPDDPAADPPPADLPPEGDKGPTRAEITRAAERAAARTEQKYKPVLAQVALRAELAEAGWTGKEVGRVMRLVDLDSVDVEGDEVIGLREQIAEIKDEFPEWFRKEPPPPVNGRRMPARTTGAAAVDGAGRDDRPPQPPRSWADRLSAQIDGL